MGNSTVIELNHDLWDEIEKHPDQFVAEIREQLASFRFNGQQITGGRVILGCHRSDWEYKQFVLFLEKIRKRKDNDG